MRITRFIWFMIMLGIGAALGLYYTWVINPVEFVDAALPHLRQDYKADYVLMVAEVYAEDHVLYQAMIRLDMLMEDSVDEAVDHAIQTAQNFGYSELDMDKLYALQSAISGGEATPTPIIDQTLQSSFLLTEAAPETTAEPETNGDASSLLPTLEVNPFENIGDTVESIPEQNFFLENGATAIPAATVTPLPQLDLQFQDQSSADEFMSFGDDSSSSEDVFVRTGENDG